MKSSNPQILAHKRMGGCQVHVRPHSPHVENKNHTDQLPDI